MKSVQLQQRISSGDDIFVNGDDFKFTAAAFTESPLVFAEVTCSRMFDQVKAQRLACLRVFISLDQVDLFKKSVSTRCRF